MAILPRAKGPVVIDSGGFSELLLYGRWRTTQARYVYDCRRYQLSLGHVVWYAIQDWMCEPVMVAKTGLSVLEHQRRTIESYLGLVAAAPELPWLPVLQGWEQADYARHLADYRAAGVQASYFGLGSVCRRQGTAEAEWIVRDLTWRGVSLHAFGFKERGLRAIGHLLHSADSMAWSYNARRHPPMPGHTHKSCANCVTYALDWRARLLAA